MSARIIQCDYDALSQVATLFGEESEAVHRLFEQVQGVATAVEQGGWVGEGAMRFLSELKEIVFPAGKRLSQVLGEAARASRRIADALQQHEDEAGCLFRGEGVAFGKTATFGGEMTRATGSYDTVANSIAGIPVRAKQNDGGNVRTRTDGLDTVTGSGAASVIGDLRGDVAGIARYLDTMFNIDYKLTAAVYSALNVLGFDVSGWQNTSDNFGPGLLGGVIGLIAKAGGSFFSGFALGQAAQGAWWAVGSTFEFFQNLFTTGSTVDYTDNYESLVERQLKNAMRDVFAGFYERYKDDIDTGRALESVANSMDAYLATHPDASFSGEVYTQDDTSYARITAADGTVVFEGTITPRAARQIETSFETHGPNFTTEGALREGVVAYMEQLYPPSQGYQAGYETTINQLMEKPDMQAILGRIAAGEVITPVELHAVINANPVPVIQAAPAPGSP
ncbi:MAG: WXG100 family type VII secretion target [Anaerolineales bacterium]|nr:WXG100 family type VII secretion target [Anaerolineales bacterium]